MLLFRFVFIVPLGSIPELPAVSCAEIKASEGDTAVSGNYWFDSVKPGEVVSVPCIMLVEGTYTCYLRPSCLRFPDVLDGQTT